MLSLVSWQEFFFCMILMLLCYYSVILMMYYRSELRQVLSGTLKPGHSFFQRVDSKNSIHYANAGHDTIIDDRSKSIDVVTSDEINLIEPQEELNELLEKLQQAFSRAADNKLVKQELLWMVQSLLKEYRFLKSTDNIITINDYVIQLADNYCSIQMGEEDMNPLWNI